MYRFLLMQVMQLPAGLRPRTRTDAPPAHLLVGAPDRGRRNPSPRPNPKQAIGLLHMLFDMLAFKNDVPPAAPASAPRTGLRLVAE